MKIKVLLLTVVMLFITACGPVTVPPAHKGKLLTPSGYQPEVLEAGKHWEGFREELILIQTNTNTYRETVNVILSDKLTLNVEIRFRGRIAGSDSVINAMFNDIEDKDGVIEFNEVYNIYGKMAVRNKTREIISQYNVDEVHKNYSRLSGEISTVLTQALKSTPLEISDVALGNIQYPDVVTKAIENAEERRLDIAREQAQAEIEMVKKDNERRLAEADYQVRITKAKAVRDENRIISEGITQELLDLKRLEVMDKMAENSAKSGSNTVFMPYEAMGSTGANVRVMSGK